MPASRPDRRVRRTTHRLKEALLLLIEQRSYDRITIDDITRLADVGRSTFYSHYTSKEDLLFSGFEEGLRALAERAPAEGRKGYRFSLPLLQHIGSQRRFALATIGGGSNAAIRRKTTAILAEVVRLELERMSPSRGQLRDAKAHGVVGAFLGLVTWWLTSGTRLSAETLDGVFQRLVACS